MPVNNILNVEANEKMDPLKKNYVRKPTGPYGMESFYIGSEYLQVLVPRKFKISDTEIQMRKLSYSTPPETVTVNGEEYFGRKLEDGSIEYLSPPLPFWAKIIVPSKNKLEPHNLFQGIQSPFISDSIEDAIIIFVNSFDFTNDQKLLENAKNIDVSQWDSDDKNSWLELINNIDIDLNILARTMKNYIFSAESTPPLIRVAFYDALLNSNTAQKQKVGNSEASYIYHKKYGFNSNLAPAQEMPKMDETEVCILSLTRDTYPDEVSLIFNGITYTNPPVNTEITLVPGQEYSYTMNDSFGDGWQGCELILKFKKTDEIFHINTLTNGSTKTETLTVPTEFKSVFLRTKLFNADYDLDNVKVGENGKVPFVFLPWHPDQQISLAEELASWGIATISYETIYYNYNVRSSINPSIKIRDAILDPELDNNMYPYFLAIWTSQDNFYLKSSDTDSEASPWWNNVLWSMPWNYNYVMSTTGKDSNDLSADYYNLLLKLFNSTTDKNGKSISSILDVNAHGIHAWSGGGHILDGADKLKISGLLASTSWDQTLLMNYGPSGYYGNSENFIFNEAFGPSQLRFGNDGFSHPHMSMDPLIDQYTDGASFKSSVGSNLTLQQTLRKTPVNIRSKCVRVRFPTGGHTPITIGDYTRLIRGTYNHPEIISLLPQNSDIFGIKDNDILSGVLQYKYILIISLYYRSLLQKSIALSSIHTLGLDVKQGMFNIEGAHDYDWNLRNPQWENDFGKNFLVFTDGEKLYFKDKITDEVIDLFNLAKTVNEIKTKVDTL